MRSLRQDSIFNPSIMGSRHYEYCSSRGLFASPFSVWILTSCNQLSLVVNSSINFVVYCFVGRSFRRTLFGLFRRQRTQRGGAAGGGGFSSHFNKTTRGRGGFFGGGGGGGGGAAANVTLADSPPPSLRVALADASARSISTDNIISATAGLGCLLMLERERSEHDDRLLSLPEHPTRSRPRLWC